MSIPIDTVHQQLDKMLQDIGDFGQVQLIITRHLGQISKYDGLKVTKETFQDPANANAQAATKIYHLMDAISKAGETGTLGLSLSFTNGKAKVLQVQDFVKGDQR